MVVDKVPCESYGAAGRNGNYSTNYQNTGRELMTLDEVRMLDNRYALLFYPWRTSGDGSQQLMC